MALRDRQVSLWQIPARSPDLNPIERYWAWLRRTLRKQDLKDMTRKRPVPGRMMYGVRVRRVVASRASQLHASKCVRGLAKVCREVLARKGHCTSG